MARKKKHSRLSPAQACGIEPALHQRYSDGCWCTILLGKWNHRRSSAPTPIWIQPKSSRTSQSDGKWRSLFRRCAPTSELKPNANGQKTRSREPHQHCSVSTVWFVSGGSRLWRLIGCHMLRRGMKKPTLHSPMQLLWFAVKSFYHTPRLTESVTKINLAYSNDCYTRFASPHNVQSRAQDEFIGVGYLNSYIISWGITCESAQLICLDLDSQ